MFTDKRLIDYNDPDIEIPGDVAVDVCRASLPGDFVPRVHALIFTAGVTR